MKNGKPMSVYEQAICWLAYSNEHVIKTGGKFVSSDWRFLFFAGAFKELIKNKLVDRVESFPLPMYSINTHGLQVCMKTWRAHGWNPYYPQPGIISVREMEPK